MLLIYLILTITVRYCYYPRLQAKKLRHTHLLRYILKSLLGGARVAQSVSLGLLVSAQIIISVSWD